MDRNMRGKANQGKRRGIRKLGYEEWRRRELERLVIYSGYRDEDKLQMLKEVLGDGKGQGVYR